MKTHLHLLVWTERTQAFAPAMQALQISYWHCYAKHYGYRGHLWHSRYRCIFIERETHLLQCGGYIEVNPVHAGIVDDPGEYRWSSYRYYAHGEADPLVTPDPNFQSAMPSMDRAAYREFVRSRIDREYQRQIKSLAQFTE